MTALSDLAAQIEAEHLAVLQATGTALRHAVSCGDLLIQAKAAVGHGAWLPWLRDNSTLSVRTAQAYMQLARELPQLPEANAQTAAHLSLRDAFALLGRQCRALRGLPQATAAQVIADAERDRLEDRLTRALNHECRRAHQPARLPPPDARLVDALLNVIEEFGLPRPVVLETLSAVACHLQSRAARSRYAFADELDEQAAD